MQKSSSKQEQSCKVVFENSKSAFLSGLDENPPRTCPGAPWGDCPWMKADVR